MCGGVVNINAKKTLSSVLFPPPNNTAIKLLSFLAKTNLANTGNCAVIALLHWYLKFLGLNRHMCLHGLMSMLCVYLQTHLCVAIWLIHIV